MPANDTLTLFALESKSFSCDHVQIRELRGTEQISQLFVFDLLVIAEEAHPLDTTAIVGADVTLVFSTAGVETRRIHGIISEAVDLLDSEPKTRGYRVRLVPRVFRMSLVRTQEAFVGLGYEAILQQKLALVGLDGEAQFTLNGKYEPRDFVVQFDETDLDFISRLAEHLGWSFVFDHKGERDRIVFTDSPSGFGSTADATEVPFKGRGEHSDIYHLELTNRLIPAAYVVSDYNYQTPRVDLSKGFEVPGGYAGGVVEYGTNHRTPAEGSALATVRGEQRATQHAVYQGTASLCTLTAGGRVKLVHHPRLGDVELLVTSVTHHGTQVVDGFGGSDVKSEYETRFEAIPGARPYRPARLTPKPRIHGVMPGIIESPPGASRTRPYIDEHGRYLVRLLFDTAAAGKNAPSLPVRMLQAHSGPGYGVHYPLRPGVEVAVAFLGGDPDRPIIVGTLPHALTPSPVVDRDAVFHRVKTSSGVTIEINDGR